MGFICEELVGVYLSSPRGKAFKGRLLSKFTESTLFLRNRSSDGCEPARFDSTQHGAFKGKLCKVTDFERPHHFCAVACEKSLPAQSHKRL